MVFAVSFPKYLVLEVGPDKPGDMGNLLNWIKPNLVVVTRLPEISVHVEHYKSPEEVSKEESLPALVLTREGILILNDDDEKVVSLRKNFAGKVLTYGLTPRADINALSEEIIYGVVDGRRVPTGMRFFVNYGNNKVQFEILGAVGIAHIYAILGGIATAVSLGGKLENLVKAFNDYEIPRGRMCIIPGIKGVTIVDDSYNSSPVAAEIALQTLKRIEGKRKIAALGDMRELGSYAKEEHQKLGKLVADTADVLITVGPLSKYTVEGALNNGLDEKNIYQFDDSQKAGKFLETILREGDIVLAKGSQNTIFMERLVREVMLHPEMAEKLLVRQEEEWQRK